MLTELATNNMFTSNLCTEKQAQTIGKIFTPYSLNFIGWAVENLDKKVASEFVGKLLYKTLNRNSNNYTHTARLYEECRKELETLGFTEEMKDKYSPFNR